MLLPLGDSQGAAGALVLCCDALWHYGSDQEHASKVQTCALMLAARLQIPCLQTLVLSVSACVLLNRVLVTLHT
jgi:hypothetical protein